ncbi:MAG TPA: Hpt domain-containing protein [Rhizobium sp.]|nr:Hpt domain-containing protein [Rhizobium sp.]
MASLNIVFDAPDNCAPRCPSRTRPIDLVHLATKTKGDKGAEIEILQMFARQARICLHAFSGGDSRDAARAAAGRLRNAALSVGAFGVSTAAEAVERDMPDTAGVAALCAAVLEVENFILKICR